MMSIHYRDKCYIAKDIICNVPVETHWKKQQPNIVIRGFAKDVKFKDDVCYIN